MQFVLWSFMHLVRNTLDEYLHQFCLPHENASPQNDSLHKECQLLYSLAVLVAHSLFNYDASYSTNMRPTGWDCILLFIYNRPSNKKLQNMLPKFNLLLF